MLCSSVYIASLLWTVRHYQYVVSHYSSFVCARTGWASMFTYDVQTGRLKMTFHDASAFSFFIDRFPPPHQLLFILFLLFNSSTKLGTMVKFTSQVASTVVLAGIFSQGVDAFAGLKAQQQTGFSSALKMVSGTTSSSKWKKLVNEKSFLDSVLDGWNYVALGILWFQSEGYPPGGTSTNP